MIEFKNIEFSLVPSGKIQYSVKGGMKIYEINDCEFTAAAMTWLNNNYPDVVKKLETKFHGCIDKVLLHWKIVTNFFACKCGMVDNVLDIDENGVLHSEFMPCPNRLFCKYKVCDAKPKYRLTPAESEIMTLLADGLSHKSIAMIIKKTPDAVKSTICRACKRFGIEVNGKKLVSFCYKKGLL